MAARPDCSIAITFAGFPIHVTVFSLLSSRRNASFKMLDPVHKMPVAQKLLDVDGNVVERADTVKGVEPTKGSYVALPPDALEMIENVGRSSQVEVERFAPVDSVPFTLSLQAYKIVPDEKIPGSEQPVSILWNGLRESQRAAVIPDWTPKANSRPSTFVIRATGDGLEGNLIPFGSELKADLPGWAPQADAKAAQMFAAVIEQQYSTDEFDLATYTDGYGARRAAAVELALKGEITTPVEKPAAAAAAPPDLMAALEASLASGKKPAKKPAAKKSTKAAA